LRIEPLGDGPPAVTTAESSVDWLASVTTPGRCAGPTMKTRRAAQLAERDAQVEVGEQAADLAAQVALEVGGLDAGDVEAADLGQVDHAVAVDGAAVVDVDRAPGADQDLVARADRVVGRDRHVVEREEGLAGLGEEVGAEHRQERPVAPSTKRWNSLGRGGGRSGRRGSGTSPRLPAPRFVTGGRTPCIGSVVRRPARGVAARQVGVAPGWRGTVEGAVRDCPGVVNVPASGCSSAARPATAWISRAAASAARSAPAGRAEKGKGEGHRAGQPCQPDGWRANREELRPADGSVTPCGSCRGRPCTPGRTRPTAALMLSMLPDFAATLSLAISSCSFAAAARNLSISVQIFGTRLGVALVAAFDEAGDRAASTGSSPARRCRRGLGIERHAAVGHAATRPKCDAIMIIPAWR
jgi:hypothetical protein